MANDERTGPIFQEMFGKGGAGDERLGEAAPEENDEFSPPLHRMHEQRMVRSAGQMAIGCRMPAPIPVANAGPGTPVFSSSDGRGSGVSRAALLLTCAIVIGGVAVYNGNVGEPEAGPPPSAGTETKQPDVDTTAEIPTAPQVQALAISQAPVGATRGTVDAGRSDGPGSGFIRIAQKDAPGLNVSNVFGPAGKPIRVPVSLTGTRPEDYSFLMFRGLPTEVTLSAGFRLKESWAVSLRDLENLTLETPSEFQGAFNLEVLLVKGRDTPAESRVITVEIVPQDLQIPPATTASNQPAAPGPQVLTAAPRTVDPAEKPVDRVVRPVPKPAPSANRAPAPARPASQEEETMMRRANALLDRKDVMSARLVLEHLANNGSARAAFTMGKTYDPAYLRTLDVAGLIPDIDKAREWYRRAADLGDSEAASRLGALANR
jgi:hypothetical protein